MATFDPLKPYDYTGKKVSERIGDIISQDSALMQQARQQGLRSANRRGLLNSSIAVGAAQDAVTRTALPIASQESDEDTRRWTSSQGLFGQREQIASSERMQGEQIASTEKIARENIVASLREKAGAAATALESVYSQSFGSIMENPNLKADVRESYLGHIGRVRDSSLGLLQQLYGVSLDWTPATTPSQLAPQPVSPQQKASKKAAEKAALEARRASLRTGLNDGRFNGW